MSINLLISGFRSVYEILVLDICVWSAFFAALAYREMKGQTMWLVIYVRMMLLFLERVSMLSSSLVMRGVDESLLCRVG